jgi:hypothetical protein
MSPILGDEVWAALADSAGRWPRSVCLRTVGLDPFTYLPWTAFPRTDPDCWTEEAVLACVDCFQMTGYATL